MSEEFDPDVVAKFELETWSRCADDYVNTFAGITGETVPLLSEAARIRPGFQVLEIGSGPGHVADFRSYGVRVKCQSHREFLLKTMPGVYPVCVLKRTGPHNGGPGMTTLVINQPHHQWCHMAIRSYRCQ